MRFKNFPTIVALIAALIACIITIIYKYEVTKALLIILGSLIVFFFIGLLFKALFNKTMIPIDEIIEEASEEAKEASAE